MWLLINKWLEKFIIVIQAIRICNEDMHPYKAAYVDAYAFVGKLGEKIRNCIFF